MPVSQSYLESRKMPTLRLLIALVTGILLQWYLDVASLVWWIVLFVGLLGYLLFFWVPAFKVFALQWLRGVCILLMMVACGGFITYEKNALHQKDNYTHVYQAGDAIVATVNESLLEKSKTYKANATINAVYHNKKYLPATGTVIIYFSKDSIDPQLRYGSQILFTDSLQAIKNTGNPGASDYRRFLLFQGVTATVFLKSSHYLILPHNRGSSFFASIIHMQNYILQTLRTYIPNRKEQGVAEALLIGYRNDLDKTLVQSYSNTGVVHIIAISGLHLGMIYGFIVLLFSRFKNRKWYRFVMPVTALFVLWLFSLLAGLVPSILRSAVTFTFIAVGVLINRKGSIYNTLAASAFCLLVVNPFYLWDVGFQLSYAAVLSITLFARPIYNNLYFQNPLLNKLWLAASVTLAAQILTLPIVLYNFHQFPLVFLITNLMVIFLSEVLLFAMLFLLIIGKWAWLAIIAGTIIQSMLWLMNTIIERTEQLPYSVLPNVKTDVVEAWLLFIVIILLAIWLLYKSPRYLLFSLSVLLLYFIYDGTDAWQANGQSKLVVYNINHHNLVDVVAGRNAVCFCDAGLLNDVQANSFYVKPCRTTFRIRQTDYKQLPSNYNLCLRAHGKTILLLSKPLPTLPLNQKMKADIILITNNAKLYADEVVKAIDCPLVVADNSVSVWKENKWKLACDSLHIRFYSVRQQGAFVSDL